MLSMQLSKRFVQQIVLDGFAFVGILNNLLDCYNESNTDLNEDETCRVIKISNGNSMYVKHWVSGGSDEYTNYFRAVAINYTSGYIGGKWATVNMNVPITSNAYKIGKVHSIAGRGNSKHSLNDGNYRVSLHGWFYGDIN